MWSIPMMVMIPFSLNFDNNSVRWYFLGPPLASASQDPTSRIDSALLHVTNPQACISLASQI